MAKIKQYKQAHDHIFVYILSEVMYYFIINKNNKLIVMSFKLPEQPDIHTAIESSQQLQQHLLYLIKKEQQIMNERLYREQQKQQKIKKIEDDFVKWASVKNEQYGQQIEKAHKNKEQHLQKIVKKCRNRNKYLVKKQDHFKIVKKKQINSAWVKTGKLNQDLKQFYQSRETNRLNKVPQNNCKSVYFPEKTHAIDNEQSRNQIQNKSISIMKAGYAHTYLNNNSNIFGITQFGHEHDEIEDQPEEYETKHMQVIKKMKTQQELEQIHKIQSLGEKLQRIQKSRAKKLQRLKKSNKQIILDREERDYINTTKKQFNNNTHKNEKLHSETFWRRSRVKDHSLSTRQKREEMLEQHLLEGDSYLQNLKVRHIKTVLEKNIAQKAVEKKLFLSRLHI